MKNTPLLFIAIVVSVFLIGAPSAYAHSEGNGRGLNGGSLGNQMSPRNGVALNGGADNNRHENGRFQNTGSRNGGSRNGGASNGGRSNGGASNGGRSNGGRSNGGASNGGASNGAGQVKGADGVQTSCITPGGLQLNAIILPEK